MGNIIKVAAEIRINDLPMSRVISLWTCCTASSALRSAL